MAPADVEAYVHIWQGILIGIGIGWFVSGLASTRPWQGFVGLILWIIASGALAPFVGVLIND